MNKLIALLLALSMLIVSVGAFAEPIDPEPVEVAADETASVDGAVVVEGEVELTDDIDEEAEIAALVAEPVDGDDVVVPETVAPIAFADLVDAALTAGRKIETNISLETFGVAEDLNGFTVDLSAQNNGVSNFSYNVAKNGEVMFDGSISGTDDELYVRMLSLGDETYKICMSDLTDLVDAMLDFVDLAAEVMELDQFMDTYGLNDLSVASLTDFDFASLNLTPMTPAVLAILSNTTVMDIEDIVPGETGEAYEGEDGIGDNASEVAMMVNTVITRDDMSILINSIAATVKANDALLAPLGIDVDEFTALANAMADTFDEDIAISAGLDADGKIVYLCADFTHDDGIATRIQYYEAAAEEGTGVSYVANVLTTGDETENFIKVFTLEADVDVNTFHLEVVQGDIEDTASGFQLTLVRPYGEITDYLAEIDTISVENGITSYPFTLMAEGTLTVSGDDFVVDGTLKASANDAQDPIFTAAVKVATADPDVFDFSDAIDVGEMDANEDRDIFGELLDTNDTITE